MIIRVLAPALPHLRPALRLAGPARPVIGLQGRRAARAAARGRCAAPHQSAAPARLGRPRGPRRADPAPAREAASAPAGHPSPGRFFGFAAPPDRNRCLRALEAARCARRWHGGGGQEDYLDHPPGGAPEREPVGVPVPTPAPGEARGSDIFPGTAVPTVLLAAVPAGDERVAAADVEVVVAERWKAGPRRRRRRWGRLSRRGQSGPAARPAGCGRCSARPGERSSGYRRIHGELADWASRWRPPVCGDPRERGSTARAATVQVGRVPAIAGAGNPGAGLLHRRPPRWRQGPRSCRDRRRAPAASGSWAPRSIPSRRGACSRPGTCSWTWRTPGRGKVRDS